MALSQAVALLLVAAALASYVNCRFLRLPSTIGMTAMALAGSIVLIAVDAATPLDVGRAVGFVSRLDFRQLVLDGFLPFLLFAGGLHVDLAKLREVRRFVIGLDTVGVALAALLVGGGLHLAAQALGVPLTLLQALLFGALIAPTDPIAVLGILKSAGAPAAMEATLSGESLFNDGVGIVLFLTLLGAATGESALTAGAFVEGFVVEGIGGLAFGALLGWAGSRLLSRVDDYPLEIFLTLALASGGYALASALHLSGPLTAAAAGLVVGSFGRRVGMSRRTEEQLDAFWIVVDQMLNAVLFMLVGLEMVVISHDRALVVLGLAAIPIVLLARACSVAAVLLPLQAGRALGPGAVRVLSWGGLRGGISLALALSVPAGALRDALVTVTYVVVAFSVLVQGLTLRRVIRGALDALPQKRSA